MKAALLVIDVQNIWLNMSAGLRTSTEQRVSTINAAIALFRKKGCPIIRIYHVDKEEGPQQNTVDFEFLPSVQVTESDAMVIKNYPNAFNKTELAGILTQEGIDVVVLSGLSATGCVMATYVGAEDHDLHPFLLRDGVAAGSEEKVRFAEEIFETLSIEALKQML